MAIKGKHRLGNNHLRLRVMMVLSLSDIPLTYNEVNERLKRDGLAAQVTLSRMAAKAIPLVETIAIKDQRGMPRLGYVLSDAGKMRMNWWRMHEKQLYGECYDACRSLFAKS